jgi:hypothetical protein
LIHYPFLFAFDIDRRGRFNAVTPAIRLKEYD